MQSTESSGLIFPRPFMYGIQSPDGTAYLDVGCVHNDPAVLECVHAPELPPGTGSVAAFWRQPRYLVLKKSDLYALALAGQLSGEEAAMLASLADKLANIRTVKGKPPLRCVVVKSDWPEYEATRAAVEKRISEKSKNETHAED